MEQRTFCEYCMSETVYRVHKIEKISILKGEEIKFLSKIAICSSCNNEIFISEVCDYNLKYLYEEYKKSHDIIQIQEIKNILVKYNINDKSLALLLGWKSDTIDRYLKGDIPEASHSNFLKKIYENTNYYLIILATNKERIHAGDYNKSRQVVNQILSASATEEKLEAVIKYILIRCEDLTPDTIEKLLYYVQGFYYVFTDDFIFNEDCEASIDGPIYRSVFDRYKKFGCEEVNRSILNNHKLKLEDAERNVVESVIKFYGCYSSKILKQMTQNEAPWVLTRNKIIRSDNFEDESYNVKIDRNLITEYFIGIKEKYDMMNLLDIQKYSIDLFNKISM